MSVTRHSVMISSTYKELKEHRDAVISAVLGQKMFPLAMETDSAIPDRDLIDASLAKVNEADAYVGLVSYRYGQTPVCAERNRQELSLTELEYQRAVERGLPRCMFIMHDDHPVTRGEMHRESEALVTKLKAFVERVKQDRIIYAEFKSVDDLKAKVVQSMALLKERLTPEFDQKRPPTPRTSFDIARISAYAPEALIGRETETAVLVEVWDKAAKGEAHPHVLTFVALGGEGKTSLVASWANQMAARGWPGCEAAFAWSFYRQSSSDQAGASSDLFFAQAFEVFGLSAIERESGYDKGKRLARHLGERRALLILDGMEPLQYAPSPAHNGELKDEGVNALLRGLAGHNAGLCVVTTRYRVADLKGPAAPQRDLASLSDEAGAELLARLGVKGSEAERRRLSAAVKGHALTLEIVGGYLRDAWGGDIAKRDLVTLKAASAHARDHAFRAMQAYADWFASAGEEGARLLAMLRLTGLFDRPVSATCLGALLEAPVIEGLTEALFACKSLFLGLKRDYEALPSETISAALSRLEKAKLINVARGPGGALVEIDAHPLLREYFADDMRKTRPEAWRFAHRRLYEHLKATPNKKTPTLDDLAPFYQAVMHGCAAGLWQEACDDVYSKRISRGTDAYAVRMLGAYGADLGAVACFFEAPWQRVSPRLTPGDQGWMLNMAGFHLRALGRLDEAREPLRAALKMSSAREIWKNAANSGSNLSELELTLGGVAEAIRLGTTAVAHADRSDKAFQRLVTRTTEADARHQAGEAAAAESLFAAAEALQAEQPGQPPRLYALAGYLYCDLKLGAAETAAWRRLISTPAPAPEEGSDALTDACAEASSRASEARAIAERHRWLLAIGLDRLTLARAALYAAVVRGETPSSDAIDAAVASLRRSGSQHHLPRPLLTRALYRAVTNDFPGSREDLDNAYEIAERGPMRLHLADIHLHRARLFGLLANRPPAYPWTSPQDDLAQARKLIVDCGYGRRLPELEDAEAALRAL